MKMWILLLTIITSGLADDEIVKPSFRIVAPQVICRDMKDPSQEQPKQTTISMQTKGGQRLSYRVQMFFEVLGGFRGQQHSLKLWDSVRRLENKINTKETELISQKNQINVNNMELTTGVYYTFMIVGIDENGLISDPQNYTVTFSDGKIKRTNPDGTIIPDGVSFQLLGAENTYSDVAYIVEALVSFCEIRYDYLFKWEISGFDQADWVRIPGHILRIPAGQLRGGEIHKITVSLVQSNDSVVILYQSITVQVLERGFTASLVPEGLSIGISKPIEFNLHYLDSDNTGQLPQIVWSCESIMSSEPCLNFEASNNYVQTAEFMVKGDYVVTAMVSLGNITKTTNAAVKVDPNIIVQTFFREAVLQDIPSGHGFQLDTTIDDLIPKCQAKWTVVNETDFEFFDSAMFPADLGNLTVLDMEGNFLSELVDYVNTTISRDITLNVPDANEEFGWPGLTPNAKYKFRLITMCPAPISDVENPPTEQEMVSSFVDITITTNQPPVGQDLEIAPLNGTALKTIFKFSTGVAGDLESDYPLKYAFQCQVEGFTISLGEYFENMVVSAVLPFSTEPIRTMYEVCDSRSACSTVWGPNVTINAIPFSQDEFNSLLNQIRSSVDRMEYAKALKMLLIAGLTFRTMDDSAKFEELQIVTNQLIAAEIVKLEERRNNDQYYVPRELIVDFVRSAQITMSIFTETEENLQNLVGLLNSTPTNVNEAEIIRRRRRSIVKKSSYRYEGYISEIEAHLAVEESLMNSSNLTIVKMAKYNMTQSIHKHLLELCKHEVFSDKTFDKPSVQFGLRQANNNQLLHNNFTVPMKGELQPAYVSFNGMLLASVNVPSRFCVGTIKYPSDYLTGDTDAVGSYETYEIIVIKVNANNAKSLISLTDVGDLHSFELYIPFYAEEDTFTIQCQIWENSSWTAEPCRRESITNNYVKCKCNRVGYFRAIPIALLPVPATTNAIASTHISQSTQTAAAALVTPAQETTETVPTFVPATVVTETLAVTTQVSVTTDAITSTPISQSSQTAAPALVTPAQETTETVPTFVATSQYSVKTSETTEPIQETNLSIISPIMTETTLPTTVIVTTKMQQKQNITLLQSSIKTDSSGSIAGFVLAGIFLVLGLSIGTGMYVYYKRSKPNTLAQQLDVIASEVRESIPGIKYARFHEEHTMRGDNNSETLFNVH